MNFYVIKSTVDASFEIDKLTLSYPAQITDLRVGIVYVLESISGPSIRIGGSEKILKTFYVRLENDGTISNIINGINYPEANVSYTHTAAIIIPVSEVGESPIFFRENYASDAFAFTALINGGSYEVVTPN